MTPANEPVWGAKRAVGKETSKEVEGKLRELEGKLERRQEGRRMSPGDKGIPRQSAEKQQRERKFAAADR